MFSEDEIRQMVERSNYGAVKCVLELREDDAEFVVWLEDLVAEAERRKLNSDTNRNQSLSDIYRGRSELKELLRRLSPRSLHNQKERFEPATLDDYLMWLEGFLRRGKPTRLHSDMFQSTCQQMFIARTDFTTNGERGTRGMKIIVPEGVTADISRGLGSNQLYYSDGAKYGLHGSDVPVYSNIEFYGIPQLRDFIDEPYIREQERALGVI